MQTEPMLCWFVFRNVGVDFAVELPAQPTLGEERDDGPQGPCRSVTAELNFADLCISVSQSDRCGGRVDDSQSDQEWLDTACDTVAKMLGVPLLNERRLTVQGCTAADFSFGCEGFYARARVIIADTHVFTLVITRLVPFDGHPVAERIFNSLSLIDTPRRRQ